MPIAAPPTMHMACLDPGIGSVAFLRTAEVRQPRLMLSDVADLSGLAPQMRTRVAKTELPFAIRRNGTIPFVLIAASIRARVPELACALPRNTEGVFDVDFIEPVERSFAGTQRQPESVSATQSGDHLALTVNIGAVRVERDVEVLQPAKAGQRLFVRDGDGKLLSVRYLGHRP